MQTNWSVITGPPSSGKTEVVKYLEKTGFLVRHEVARQFIDEEIKSGKNIEEILGDPKVFQLKLMPRYIDCENGISPDQSTIFDRALPDYVAYSRLCGLPADEVLAICCGRKYRQIFFMDRLPEYMTDYARANDEKRAEEIEVALLRVYCELGYEIVFIPFATIEERAKMILKRLETE